MPNFSGNFTLIALTCLLAMPGLSLATDSCPDERKYNPGHYVSPNNSGKTEPFEEMLRPGVMGLQIRYRWADLEPEQGNYQLEGIRADLQKLQQTGAHLIVFIEDKSFDGSKPTPAYLHAYTLINRNRGYTVKRWDPFVIDRMRKLIAAVGAEFDCERGFEGIALQESALSLEDELLAANGYTPLKYRDALIEVLSSAADDLPHSRVFWYMNFLRQKQAYIPTIADAVAKKGVAMGGPDILPDNRSLSNSAYPFYGRYKEQMILFGAMQYDSFAHVKTTVPGAEKTYWTMEELFQFARDDLHVKYIFWNHKTWRRPADSYDWEDAIPVIAAHPQFNQ